MRQSSNRQGLTKYVSFCSILVAIYINIPSLNQIFIAFLPGMAGKMMTLLYGISIAGVIFAATYCILNNRKVDMKLFLYILGIVFVFLLTCCFASYTSLNIFDFISYTIVALLIPLFFKIDAKLFLRTTIFCSFWGIFFINDIFELTGSSYQTITMGVSYAFLPSIIVSIVYLFMYIKNDSKKEKLFCGLGILVNAVYLLKILQYGSRGPVLCIATCLCFLFCFRYKNEKNGIETIAGKFIVLIGIIFLCVINIWTILEWVQTFLNSYDIHINTIDKIFRLVSSSKDISNGRTAITEVVIGGIFESPVWGHGMSTTMHNLNIVYPHNFILQLMYDGGLLLTIPILFSILFGLIKIFKSCTFDEYAIVCAMFFMSVPGALFSGDLWESNRLWLTIAVLILGNKIKKFIL